MIRPTDWLPQRIYYLASGLYFGAVFLRTVLVYRGSPSFGPVLGLLLAMLALYISQPFVSLRWPRYFPVYLACQTILVFLLLTMPGSNDFFGTLFSVLSMQAMLHLKPKSGALWVGFSTLIMTFLLAKTNGVFQAIALALIYSAGMVFLGTFTLAIRRAQAARLQNQQLAGELEAANQRLNTYAAQLEQLAVARERNRMARELHDSVTQTVFSMTLTTQSATLMLERGSEQTGAYLERLNQLARSALAEVQLLISELAPEKLSREGLVAALRRHIASSRIPENLSIDLEVDGNWPLEYSEEQNLFHIAEEALNNIVKHAHTSQAQLRLHLAEPFWMEIQDQGQGFDPQQVQDGGKFGLASMSERALEIGWDLQVISSPSAGTRIRVEKRPKREGQA